MASQKGIELVMKALPHLLRHYRFQFIVLGGGDELYRQFFLDLSMKFPKKVGVHLRPNFRLPRKIFAGADVMLMPSKFEPGGIVAMEAMRYGAIPLVRRTGGLGEIVTPFDPSANTGTGFLFDEFDPWALYGAMVESLTVYKSPVLWKKLAQNAMRADFSWDHAAKEYEALYQSLSKAA
jgi:starch synthase